MDDAVAAVVAAHREAGTFFRADGVESFVRAQGEGEAVVMLHGLPASSFLYRKLIPLVAAEGFHALAFDLPGLGLAQRPEAFDYSIAGLGAFASGAVDALGLDRFHLVVHDAGGPVGFEMVLRQPDRIRSLTVLNTVVELASAPFPGEMLARLTSRVRGPMASRQVWRLMMQRVGVLDHHAVPAAELEAYRDLALGPDDGAAYLRIMASLRPSGTRPRDYRPALDTSHAPYPVQLIWGANDPILRLRTYGYRALAATGLPALSALPGRHFLQEDQAPALAAMIARHAASAA